MTQIAIRPDAGIVRKAVASYGILNAKKQAVRYREKEYSRQVSTWTNEFFNYFWIRNAVALPLVVLPIALIAVTTLTLFGYLWLMLPVISMVAARGLTKSNSVDVKAYEITTQLKDGWRDHGETFYRQIWNHDCDGQIHGHSYNGCLYRSSKCDINFTACVYCDDRLTELEALLESQQKVEVKMIEPINESLFEASEQFRKAVEEQLEPSNTDKLMKEISSKAGKK